MPAPTMKTHGHLAALGALGVCGGCVLIYALVFWISLRTPTGGLDYEHAMITRISIGVIFAAIIAAHYAFARQLFAYVKENR